MGKLAKVIGFGVALGILMSQACGKVILIKPDVFPGSSQSAITQTLEARITPTPFQPEYTFSPTPTATATLDPLTSRVYSDMGLFLDKGFTQQQFETYAGMTQEEKQAFYELVELGGSEVDFYSLKLTPDSLSALWGYLSAFDDETARELLRLPNSPIAMMGARAYVLDLSDNSSPYLPAMAMDFLGEDFGLQEMLVVDNSEETREFSSIFDRMYKDVPSSLGATVQDRVDELLEFRQSPQAQLIGRLKGEGLVNYIDEEGIRLMRNANMPEVLTAIGELERLAGESAGKKPVVIYMLSHTHLSSRVMVNDGNYPNNYLGNELFPPEFLKALEGEHLTFVINTCPLRWLDRFETYLNEQGVEYTILASYVDESTWTPIEEMGEAISVAIAAERPDQHPLVDLGTLDRIAAGELYSSNVRMETIGEYNRYMFAMDEQIDGRREMWPSEVSADIIIQGSQTAHIIGEGERTFNVDFDPVVRSNLPYQELVPFFGLKLEQMK